MCVTRLPQYVCNAITLTRV